MILSRATLPALLLGTSLLALAAPANAASFSVTGISIEMAPGVTFDIPTVTVEDGNITETDIRTLFSADPTASLPAIADLDAASITIPEIRFAQTLPAEDGAEPMPFETIYKDIRFLDVVDGVARTLEIGSMWQDQAGTKSEGGKTTVTDLDIGATIRFLGYAEPGASTDFTTIYKSADAEGGSITSPIFGCTYGASTGGSFFAKPMPTPASAVISAGIDFAAIEEPDEAQKTAFAATMVHFVADLLMSIRSEPTSLAGFNCSGAPDGAPVTLTTGALTFDGLEPGVYLDFGLGGLNVDAGEAGKGSLEGFTFKSIDFRDAIATVKEAPELSEAWFEANWRKIIPAFEGLTVAGLDLDVIDPENPGERIQASMDNLDLTLGNYVNAIPSDIALKIVDLIVPLPASGEAPVPELRARGIDKLTLDAETSLVWNADDSTITVRNLLLDADELGSIRVSGTLGNATETLFADDPDAITVAAQMLTLKDLTIAIDDRGIGSLIVANAAREAGQPEGSLRMQVSGMAQGMTLAVLGNTDDALVAAQSLGKFLGGKARSIEITLTANDPAGLGIADIAAFEQDPTALAGKLAIKATADGEPVTLPEPAAAPEDSTSTQDEKLGVKN